MLRAILVQEWIKFIDKSVLSYTTILELTEENSASREDHAKHIKTETQLVFMYRNVKKTGRQKTMIKIKDRITK